MGTLRNVGLGLAAVLGLGIISKRFEGGLGLGELGTGITQVGSGVYEVAVSPFKAVGMGLGYVGGGLSSILDPLERIFSLVTGQQPVRPDDRPNGNGNGNGNGQLPMIPIPAPVLPPPGQWNL